ADAVAGADAVAQADSPLDAYVPPLPEPEPEPIRPPDGINPFVDTAEDDLSTFGLDVDSGSFDLAAAAIESGRFPQADQVRVEEFVNAQDYGYDADASETFTVSTDLAPSPFTSDPDNALLRIGLSTPQVDERGPASLVFVVDTSGSMADHLPLVQDALRTLAVELEPGDDVAIVTYSTGARAVLDATDASNRASILEGISSLQIGGSTNLEAGLDLGYQIARGLAGDDRTTRVILTSDGIANVGNTSPERILDTAQQAASEGIELVTVGFGLDGFNDPLMEQLADQGDGFYAYVDSLQEADTLFRTDLVATQPAIAREARAQVVFDRDQVVAYRLLGYENRDIADEDFRNDDIDAGELVAGHTVTALYELQLAGRNTGNPLATVQLRWLDPADGAARERAHDVTAANITRDWRDAPVSFRLAATVGAWAEYLRNSPYAPRDGRLLRDEVEELRRAFNTPEVDRLMELVTNSV
ncbi:vWA domain-containing protein, partial [Euzebya tangerina]